MRGYHRDVEGAKLLKQHGGNYYVPSLDMHSDIRINEAYLDRTLRSFKVVFSAGNRILSLNLDRSIFPATIVVARSVAQVGFAPPLDELVRRFSERATLLMLPHLTLSSCKPPERFGHFLLKFISESKVEIIDLGSKNHTDVLKLTNEELADLVATFDNPDSATKTYAPFASEVESKDGFFTNVTSHPQQFELPILIMASKECRILIR